MRLFTFQKKERDITKPCDPSFEYNNPRGAFYAMAKYLGWPCWVWCFEHESDFFNEWMRPVTQIVKTRDLWELDVPEECIRWCALKAQCENKAPVKDWFYLTPEAIILLSDIPQGLVKSPIRPEWVTT